MRRLLGLALLLSSVNVFAIQVVKSNANYFLVKDDGENLKMDDSLCVMHGGKPAYCGKVAKIKGGQIVVRITSKPDSGQPIQPGDPVEKRSGRGVASEGGGSDEMTLDGQAKKDLQSTFQLSVELGGAALLYSVMGTYRFTPNLGVNFGFGYFSISDSATSGLTTATASTSVIQFPISLSYLMGSTNHFFEILAGGDLALVSASGTLATSNAPGLGGSFSGTTLIPELGLGYRYWPSDGGFHFRATAYGLISSGFHAWAGMTLGYAF
jgi:hypothetical protein